MRKWLIGVSLGAISALLLSGGAISGTTGTAKTYVVLYKQQSVGSDASATIQKAGGTVVYSYSQIGVVIARSASASFRDQLLRNSKIENAAATEGFGYQLPAQSEAEGPSPGDAPNTPATDTDTFSGLQWDMRQIHTPEAHAITGGSPAVLVGDIDTGIDFNHPDLIANIDVAKSVNCVSGAPVQGLAAQDDNGHGTHTAGTIAAASNGIGIVGVAPNVKIAGIKAGDASGFFFPEAVVCSFVWAATHGVDVTNNSYFADPYLFNCRNDPVQHAIWKAEQRAIQFAQQNGVTVVAAEGNQSEDLSHPSQDKTSPDDTTPVTRPVTNACVVIPVEIPGVIGVTADGNARQTDGDNDPNDYLKSFYSSFGVSTADIVAPGGDSRYGVTPEATNGRVLSTYPANQACARSVQEPTGDPTYPTAVYCYLQGTSMASPHVAGVAALVVSRYGNLAGPNDATMRPGRVAAYVEQTADPQPCPTELPPGYLAVLGLDDEQVQTCQGGPGHNSWYGNGQVNALSAITHASGN
jgi:subtilisin family serine protease